MKHNLRWPRAFDLSNLAAGSGKMLDLHSQTVQSICERYAQSRSEKRKVFLRYRGRKALGYDHLAVAERGDPEVSEEFLPIVHLVFANLKTWLNGIHHGVSPQHLQAHLNEFTFRFNRRFYPFNAFRSLLGIVGDVAAPSYNELYSGDWTHTTCSGCLP